MTDFREVRESKTNPKSAYTDGDNLTDGEEVLEFKTDPKDPDTDGEGVLDGMEVEGWKITVLGDTRTVSSDPLSSDTDNDKLSDKKEFDLKIDPQKYRLFLR